MKTENIDYQSISSLLDGELSNAQLDAALASLADASKLDERKTWDIYHQIGDVLRSDDLAISMSPDFSAKFSAMLDAEPVLLAPKARTQLAPAASPIKQGIARYMAMTSMAAAAAVAFLMAPQIIPLFGAPSTAGMQMARLNVPANMAAGTQNSGVQLASNLLSSEPVAQSENQIEMLRDPRLDSYLLAHQKFSPSMANGPQYVSRANAVATASRANEK
ncbi:sigma-E factor negative regulatory protein [Undibacterium sp. Ren11W]|uniref:sigma-E factor negative regulatory protein n=1 Tax=Undibacterium sp. Ren11W TaxID=3413045 RepID=UPI003BF18F3C